MCHQAVLTGFKTYLKAQKAGQEDVRLLATGTSSAPSHLTWEIPKGDRQ
jgi:hypothetical protein